jgi:hypothetical protein
MNVKYLDRPPLVHYMQSVNVTGGTTRCGVVYNVKDREPTLTTAWFSECTCDECDPR